MKVKRFVAADMRRALDLVKQEMGPDAAILSTSRTKQGVEVITSSTVPDQWSGLESKEASGEDFSVRQSISNSFSEKARNLFKGNENSERVHETNIEVPMQSDTAWGSHSTFGALMEKQLEREQQVEQERQLSMQPASSNRGINDSELARAIDRQEKLEGELREKLRPQKQVHRQKPPAAAESVEAYKSIAPSTSEHSSGRSGSVDRNYEEPPAPRFGTEPAGASRSDLEQTVSAHENLQIAIKEFEKTYQNLRSTPAVEKLQNIQPVKFTPIKIETDKFESSVKALGNTGQYLGGLQTSNLIANGGKTENRQTSLMEMKLSQELDSVQDKDLANEGIEHRKDENPEKKEREEKQRAGDVPSENTISEKNTMDSWWNSAFQFSSFNMDYNPDYHLYLESYDEAENIEGSAIENEAIGEVVVVNDPEITSKPEDEDVLSEKKRNGDIDELAEIKNELELLKQTISEKESIKDRKPEFLGRLPSNGHQHDTHSQNPPENEITQIETTKPKFTLVDSVFEESQSKANIALDKNEIEKFEAIKTEISDMRELFQTQLELIAKSSLGKQENNLATKAKVSPITETLSRRLQHLGLGKPESRNILSRVDSNKSLSDSWTEALAQLAHQLPIKKQDIVVKGGFYAFVGSPGCGKTAAVSKLAARYVLEHGSKGVAIVSVASRSYSNQESLKRLGKILSVPVHLVRDLSHLNYQLDELADQKLVLIDTAGLRHGDPQLKQQLSVLRQLPQVKNVLVLAANTQLQMMKASIHAYRGADLQACILSKLDDTVNLGEAFTMALQEKLPIAYTTEGHEFSKGIQPARAHHLVTRAVALLKNESKKQRLSTQPAMNSVSS